MKLDITRVEVWAASIKDRAGGLSDKLAPLADAGANLEFLVARRAPEKPGTGVVFVTPIKGAAQIRAAKKAGFRKSTSLQAVRIAATNRSGLGATITGAITDAQLSMRGASAAAIGKKAIMHLAFDSREDTAKAVRCLKKITCTQG